MEKFVNGVRKFPASIVNLKQFKNELRILKEIRGKMVTAKLQSRRECMYITHLIFLGTYLLSSVLENLRIRNSSNHRSIRTTITLH